MSDSTSIRVRGAPWPALSVRSRMVMVERVAAGQSATAVATQMGCSRQTVHKWVKRFDEGGVAGLEDRSSRPVRSPAKVPARVENRICASASATAVGSGAAGGCDRGAGFDGASGAVPARAEAAGVDRSADRGAGAPL